MTMKARSEDVITNTIFVMQSGGLRSLIAFCWDIETSSTVCHSFCRHQLIPLRKPSPFSHFLLSLLHALGFQTTCEKPLGE